MQCLVCKHSNPVHLAKCEICDSELVASQEEKQEYSSYLLCEPMNPIKLEKGKQYTLGRDYTSSVVLSSGNVSRINTIFEVTPEGVTVVDNDSRNGTFLNGVKLLPKQPQMIKDKDDIRVGPYNFIYRYILGSIENFRENAPKELFTEETMDLDTSNDISGDLSKNKCADILQMIELTKKTGLLEIYAKGGKGVFYFRDGSAIHASFLELLGIDAARKLIPLKEGTFKFNNLDKLDVEQTIQIPTHKLILDSLRMHDEDTRKIRKRIEQNKAPSDEEILEEELSSHIPKFDFFADLKKKESNPTD